MGAAAFFCFGVSSLGVDGEDGLVAVEVDGVACGLAEEEGIALGLFEDEVLPLGEGGSEFIVAMDDEVDALGDLEIGLLAEGLDAGDALAGETFRDEGGGEIGLEGDDDVVLGGDDKAFAGLAADDDIGRGDLEGLALEVEIDGLATGERGCQVGGERGDGGGGGLHAGAETGSQALEVGLEGEGREVGLVGREEEILDVELFLDDVGVLGQRVADGLVGGGDAQGGEGLAHLEVFVGAELTPEADDALDKGHVVLEREVAGLGVRGGEVAEVDALGVVGPLEVAVDLLGHEGREGRGDLGELDEDVAERAVGVTLFQKRRRERRMYQLVRSSMKATKGRTARWRS